MAEVASMTTTSAIVSAFKAIDRDLKGQDPLINKCVELCNQLNLAPSDLVLKWEAHSDQVGDDVPTLAHFDAIALRAMTVKVKKEKQQSGRMGMGMTTPYNKGTLPGLQDKVSTLGGKRLEPPSFSSPGPSQFMTPAKRRGVETPGSFGPPSSRARMLPQTPIPEAMATPMKDSPESGPYLNRDQKLKTMSSLNEALGTATNCATTEQPRCEIHVLKSLQSTNGKPFRYMYETTERKCSELKDRLKSVTDAIVENHKLHKKAEETGSTFQFSPVSLQTQEVMWCCGRINPEGDTGSLNPTSVMLEGANGRRVKLDLSQAGDFAFFPGQIVVVHGTNTTGECIAVREVFCDGSLPMEKTPASKIAIFNETDSFLNGNPMSILAASGPFTVSSDLAYKPLDDLLEHVREVKPDVLVLTGPFVDSRHKLLDPTQAGAPGGFSGGDPPDSIQVVRDVVRQHILQGLKGCPATTCLLIPSIYDLHARSVFPQPSFEAELFRAAPGEEEHHTEVKLLSNPCTLRVNEVVIGISTTDILLNLSGNETSNVSGDRLARMARHVVQQRSYYPLFPAADGTQLSMSHLQDLSLPVTPDVLILPSQLAPFAKRAGDVLCVNPGRLCKGISAGTFAKFSVHPVMRNIRSKARKVTATATAGLQPDARPDASPSEGAGDSSAQKADANAEALSSEMVPQQLSQDFESAAKETADGSKASVEGESSVESGLHEVGKVAEEAASDPQETAGKAEAPAAEQQQQQEEKQGSAAAPTATAAAGGGDVAMPDAPPTADATSESAPPAATAGSGEEKEREEAAAAPVVADAHEPTLHRVMERTRVDIIRI